MSLRVLVSFLGLFRRTPLTMLLLTLLVGSSRRSLALPFVPFLPLPPTLLHLLSWLGSGINCNLMVVHNAKSWVDADGLETEIHSTRFLSDFNKRKTPNAKGILRLTFDNSFSWIYNKTIRLLVKVGGKRYDGWKERRALMDSEARVVQEEGKESDARLEKK